MAWPGVEDRWPSVLGALSWLGIDGTWAQGWEREPGTCPSIWRGCARWAAVKKPERVARALPNTVSQGRTVSPLLSTAGRSEQREAPKGATDQGTADSMPPGVCQALLQLLPLLCLTEPREDYHCGRSFMPVCKRYSSTSYLAGVTK